MIEHIVCFKMKPDSTPEQEQGLIDVLKDLRDLAGVVDLTVGKNFSTRSQGYSVGLVVRFQDKDSLAAYLPHPKHLVVMDYVKANCDGALVVDYDI